MVEFSIRNVNIRISFLFVAALTLLSLQDKSGFVFLSVVFSFLHEMGHITAMALCKEKIDELSFYPFGISMKLSSSCALSTAEELFVLSSGCLVNLIFAIALKNPTATYINIGIFLFNALPIANLDGGRITRLFATRFFGERAGNRLSDVLSVVFLAPLSALAFYTAMDSGQFSLFICCVYLAAITIFKRDKLA